MRTTFQRTWLLCAALAVATPAAARQSVSRGEPDDPTKPQVRTFEMALGAAIQTGGRNFAKKAALMVPVIFEVAEPPQVSGVAVHSSPDHTQFVFAIQVPNILPAIQMMNLVASRGLGAQQVSNGNRVQADGVVVGDPIGPLAVNESNKPDLEREYAVSVREALIDAILDNATVLPAAANDGLIVWASGSDSTGVPSSLYQSAPRKLVITVSGSDLSDIRQGKLKREDAKQRIHVTSF